MPAVEVRSLNGTLIKLFPAQEMKPFVQVKNRMKSRGQ